MDLAEPREQRDTDQRLHQVVREREASGGGERRERALPARALERAEHPAPRRRARAPAPRSRRSASASTAVHETIDAPERSTSATKAKLPASPTADKTGSRRRSAGTGSSAWPRARAGREPEQEHRKGEERLAHGISELDDGRCHARARVAPVASAGAAAADRARARASARQRDAGACAPVRASARARKGSSSTPSTRVRREDVARPQERQVEDADQEQDGHAPEMKRDEARTRARHLQARCHSRTESAKSA